MKNTERDHKDYKNLVEAVKKVAEIAEFVNHKKQEADNLHRLVAISQLIHGLKTEVIYCVVVK